MESTIHVNLRLPNRARKFFKQGLFIDVTLVSPEGRYGANRVFLANFSGYFRRLFAPDTSPEVRLPFDEHGIMRDVLAFLRSDKLNFNMRNFHYILKAAEVYEIQPLKEAAQFCLKECVTPKTVKFATRALLDVGLVDQACQNAPLLAQDMKKLMDHGRDLGALLQYMNPRVLAAVLLQPQFASMKIEHKIKMIDDFVGVKELDNEEDRRVMEGFVDWSRPGSYKLFAKYKCAWVSAKMARPMLRKLIDVRRNSYRAMRDEIEHAASSVGRWSPFAWMTAIANGDEVRSAPTVDIVKFAATLGGAIEKPLNAADFGLIQVGSTKPLHPAYKARNIVMDDDSYFLSVDTMFTNEEKFVSLYIGQDSRFVIDKVALDSNIRRLMPPPRQGVEHEVMPARRAYPVAVEMKVNTGAGAMAKPIAPRIEFRDGKAVEEIKEQVPCCKVRFTMLGESGGGGALMRLKNVELTGHFLVA